MVPPNKFMSCLLLPHCQALRKRAAEEGCEVVVVSAKVESELNGMPAVLPANPCLFCRCARRCASVLLSNPTTLSTHVLSVAVPGAAQACCQPTHVLSVVAPQALRKRAAS
jgi:hypothetical protein